MTSSIKKKSSLVLKNRSIAFGELKSLDEQNRTVVQGSADAVVNSINTSVNTAGFVGTVN